MPNIRIIWLASCLLLPGCSSLSASRRTPTPPPAAAGTALLPALAAAHATRGQAQLRSGSAELALGECATAYVLDPAPETLRCLVRAELLLGRLDEAKVLHDSLLRSAGPGDALLEFEDRAEVDPRPLVRAYFQRGRQDFAGGRYDQAIPAFQIAYALSRQSTDEDLAHKSPRFLFNIAQAHRRAGRLREALGMYERFMKLESAPPLKVEAQGYVSELRGLLESERRPRPKTPLHRQGWLWAVVGTAAVAVAVSIGLGVTLVNNVQVPILDSRNVVFKH